MRVISLLFLSFIFSVKHRLFLHRRYAIWVLGPVLLTACGGSNKDHIEEDDHQHAGAARLIYSQASSSDTLKMFDQTLATPSFADSTVAASANAQLVLANDGLTVAMLEGDKLSLVSAGLEHAGGEHGRTHELSLLTTSPWQGVQKVVATEDYFSTLDGSGHSLLMDAEDGKVVSRWAEAVYPTLALEGDDYLVFTANSQDATTTDITVKKADGSTGGSGLIFVRPNVDGYFTPSMSCPQGVRSTAQTEDFSLILCGDGTLRWLISGYDAPEGHPQAGQTLHVTQRYPAVLDANGATVRAEGAVGEVTAGAAEKGFVRNITGLSATWHEDNVIAAWSGSQLWLINAHGDHPHRADLSGLLSSNFGDLIAVEASTQDSALAVLSSNGQIAISRFAVENNNPVAKGAVVREQLSANASWSANNTRLLAGAQGFFVLSQGATTGVLYQLDAHSDEEDYHLHGQYKDSSLSQFGSAVLAHPQEQGEHDHSHD